MKILKKENLNHFSYPKNSISTEITECLRIVKNDDSCDDKTKEYKIKYLINIMINSLGHP